MDFTELIANLDGPLITGLSFVLMLFGILCLAIVSVSVDAKKVGLKCRKHTWALDKFGLICEHCRSRPQEDTQEGDE